MPPETNCRALNRSVFTVVATLAFIQVGCGRRDTETIPEISFSHSATPIQLSDANFQQEVIDSEMPVLVDMWAPWCQPCIAMKPTIHELASELSGQVKVAELNIDENLFVKQKYNIDKYPTLLIFVDGIEVQRIIGLKSKEDLMEVLNNQTSASRMKELRHLLSPNNKRIVDPT